MTECEVSDKGVQLEKSKTVLITRPKADAEKLAQELKVIEPGLRTVISPLIKIVSQPLIVNHDEIPDCIITSQNALRSIAINRRCPVSRKAYCVGQGTSKLAESMGFTVVASESRVEELVARLIRLRPDGPLLYLRGRHVAADLRSILAENGIQIEEAIVYDQLTQNLVADAVELLTSESCLIPVYSARSARILSRQCSAFSNRSHVVFCLSNNISDAFNLSWNKVIALPPENESFALQIARMAMEGW